MVKLQNCRGLAVPNHIRFDHNYRTECMHSLVCSDREMDSEQQYKQNIQSTNIN